jgi:hypothetical protein
MNITPIFLVPLTAFSFFNHHFRQKPPEHKEKTCFCHNLEKNPVTICISNRALIEGHNNHIGRGKDRPGRCEDVPSVPEFNVLTGGLALVTSAGSYLVWKRKMRQK